MKNYLITIVLFMSTIARADVMMDLSSFYTIDTEISNMSDYNSTIFLLCEFRTHPPTLEIRCEQVAENGVIEGYFRPGVDLRVLAIPKNIYENDNALYIINHHIYDYQNGEPRDDKFYKKSMWIASLYDKYNYKNGKLIYPIDNEKRIYKITAVTDANVTLKLSKRIITFDDGTQKTIDY